MQEMFKLNKIPISEVSIKNLFFKKHLSKDPNSESSLCNSLNFSDLVTHAISDSISEKYRKLMRELKKKAISIRKETKKINDSISKIELDIGRRRSLSFRMEDISVENNKSDDNDGTFIPMNFNLLLEHFHNKGLLRENVDQVKLAIKKMDLLTKFKIKQLEIEKEEEKIKLKKEKRNDEEKINKVGEINPFKNEINAKNELIERENDIHKGICVEQLYNNFSNVVDISQKNINKIMEKNKKKEELKLPELNLRIKKKDVPQDRTFLSSIIDTTHNSSSSKYHIRSLKHL